MDRPRKLSPKEKAQQRTDAAVRKERLALNIADLIEASGCAPYEVRAVLSALLLSVEDDK